MRRLTLFAAMLLTVAGATARPIDAGRALKVAQNFWNASLGDKGTLAPAEGEGWAFAHLHLFTAEGGGFVIVAADDVARPILGYSPTSLFDPAQPLPANLKGWLAGYDRQIAEAAEAGLEAGAEVEAEWSRLDGGLATKDDGVNPVVGPLTTSKWDQQDPYNQQCPVSATLFGYTVGRAPTGCAATAQAQLMRYYGFPAFGQGSHSYSSSIFADVPSEYGIVDFGELEADFQHTYYDWSAMSDTYNGSPYGISWGTPTVAEEAVALLMSHVGISMEMMYGREASGAYGFAGDSAWPAMDRSLRDYFFYSPSMQAHYKGSNTSDAAWLTMVTAELDASHPLLYTGGTEEEGGHAFVCDGYDSRRYLHFNWGWSGNGDGYYPVSSLRPDVGGGSATGAGSYNFTQNQECLTGAVPVEALRVNDSVKAVGYEEAVCSVLVMVNRTVNTTCHVQIDAPWLTAAAGGAVSTGRLDLHAEANPTGEERTATVTFTQGDEQVTLRVVQAGDPAGIGSAHEVQAAVWPNPATDRVHVSAEGLTGLTLMSVDGRRLATCGSGAASIGLEGLPAGIYLLRVSTAEGTAVRRVVKK